MPTVSIHHNRNRRPNATQDDIKGMDQKKCLFLYTSLFPDLNSELTLNFLKLAQESGLTYISTR